MRWLEHVTWMSNFQISVWGQDGGSTKKERKRKAQKRSNKEQEYNLWMDYLYFIIFFVFIFFVSQILWYIIDGMGNVSWNLCNWDFSLGNRHVYKYHKVVAWHIHGLSSTKQWAEEDVLLMDVLCCRNSTSKFVVSIHACACALHYSSIVQMGMNTWQFAHPSCPNSILLVLLRQYSVTPRLCVVEAAPQSSGVPFLQ